MKTIPDYTIEMRDPKFGWRVVGVNHTKAVAMLEFYDWTAAYPDRDLQVMKVNERVAQCWEVIASCRVD